MTDVSLEVLNRRTTIAAVRAEAARIGADADTLLDSQAFYDRVTSLDPDSGDYHKRVQAMVAASAAPAPAPQAAPGQPAVPAGPRQWTMADVDRSTPGELTAAMNAGLLRDLGYAPKRKRGQRA